MPDSYRRMVGDDGELLVDAASPGRKRGWLRWALWSAAAGLLLAALALLLAEWPKGTGAVTPAYYRARLAETSGAQNGRCSGWNLWGAVDREQPGMSVYARDAAGRAYEGRVHTDIMYHIILSPQPQPLALDVVLRGAQGRELSEPFTVRFSGSQQCSIRLDFDGMD